MQARLLPFYAFGSSMLTTVYPRGLLSGTQPGGSYLPLHSSPKGYTIHPDRDAPKTNINVFDAAGTRVYQFRRHNAGSTSWHLYSIPDEVEVAEIKCSITNRGVTFRNKPNCGYRKIGEKRTFLLGLPGRTFFLHDGASYAWNRESKFLERISNPGGGVQEVRKRLGLVNHTREKAFEWQVLIDPDFDTEIALATAFVSMQTAWPTTGPTTTPTQVSLV